uniref:Uncharacterized protein n=1 Tax=Arundo donax TaxID=35708 RepID=A0A0A9HMU3_ARUDO
MVTTVYYFESTLFENKCCFMEEKLQQR